MHFLLVLCTVGLFSHAFSFIFQPSQCPLVQVENNFNIDDFLGSWYVIEKFREPSECLTENITAINGRYFLSRNMKPMGVQISQKGKLSFPQDETQSSMILSFPTLSSGIHENYQVLMTDYYSYAAVWSCERILFSSRQSGQIMSREPALNETVIEEIKSRFRTYGIDDDNFFKVDHRNCGHRLPDDEVERDDSIEEK